MTVLNASAAHTRAMIINMMHHSEWDILRKYPKIRAQMVAAK